MKVKVNQIQCKRCGWQWNPRKPEVRLCPHCNSAYWDRERKHDNNDN
jgi:predicted Zn-ribbon and HTH transcriptional regulator